MAQAEAKAHAPQTEHSPLASKLLLLWATGNVAATTIQELAHCALLDGASHEELAAIASTGDWGQLPGNVHRDLSARFLKKIAFCEPQLVETVALDPKTQKTVPAQAGVYHPHLQLSSLQEYEECSAIFCTDQNEAFWDAVEKAQDPKLKDHPMLKVPGWKQLFHPFFVHGDAVEYQQHDSMMVWHWGSMLNTLGSMLGGLLLAAFPKSATASETWEPILHSVVWSLTWAFQGIHPPTDWQGRSFAPETLFAANAGKPLTATGTRLVCWAIEGDHDFFVNNLGMPHWNCPKLCFECDATKDEGPKFAKELRAEHQLWELHSMQHLRENLPAHVLFQLPGVTQKHCMHDYMHNTFAKGMLSHLLGSALHTLIWPDNRRLRVSPDQKLSVIWQACQEHYKHSNPTTRLTNLWMKSFTDPERHWQHQPFLKIKASECKHFLPVLTQVCIDCCTDDPHDLHRMACLQNITAFVSLLDAAPMFLTEEQADLAMQFATDFLGHYAWLNQWAKDNDRCDYHIVPKFHFFMHIAFNARYINPRFTWCFRAEDFVGNISTLALSCASGNSSTVISHKLSRKYLHLVHLLLTRGIHQDHV